MTDKDKRITNAVAHIMVDRVDERLAVKDMTYAELGRRAGIKNKAYQQTWWNGLRRRILKGNYNPSMGMVLRCARALGTKPKILLEPFK